MRIFLVFVVSVVVAGLPVRAQRFSVPLGTAAVKEYYLRNIPPVSHFATPVSADGVTSTNWGVWIECTQPMEQDASLMKANSAMKIRESSSEGIVGAARECMPALLTQLSYSVPDEYTSSDGQVWQIRRLVEFSEDELSQNIEFRVGLGGDVLIPDADGENWIQDPVDQSQVTRIATGSGIRWVSTPFNLERDSNGKWAVPAAVWDEFNEVTFFGGQETCNGGDPLCSGNLVAIHVGNSVPWVEYNRITDGVPSVPAITRNGYPMYCFLGKSIAEGGRWGNGYVYLTPETLSGSSALAALHLHQSYGEDTKWVSDITTFWYDEDRTVGDEWTILADQSGVHTSWRPIGYRVTKASVFDGMLKSEFLGLQPNASYEVLVLPSLDRAQLTKAQSVGFLQSDELGMATYLWPIDRSRQTEFISIRLAKAAGTAAVAATH